MNLKVLITKVSAKTDLPASQVRKVANAVLETLRANVESGVNFASPHLGIRAVTTKPSEKVDDQGNKITIPSRNIGRLIPQNPKPKG